MVDKLFILFENIKDFLLKKYRKFLHDYKHTYVKIQKGETMPYGVGTYGSKKGRPPKKKKANGLTAKQKTLPSALQKKIMKAKKKKK